MHWSNILGVMAAGASAVAAFVAWRTSVKANETAEAVARIERERWHAERSPRFDIGLQESGGGHARLTVHLNGPDVLGELDELPGAPRDVREERGPRLPGELRTRPSRVRGVRRGNTMPRRPFSGLIVNPYAQVGHRRDASRWEGARRGRFRGAAGAVGS